MRLQQPRLQGISVAGVYEPGDALVDKCIAMYDADRVQYLAREICTRMHGNKRDQTLTFDASGTIKLRRLSKSEPCSTATEIQVRYCLIRRALAMEQANLLDFKLMESRSEKMMQARLEDAPPNYQKATMKQLETADRKLFLLISEKARQGKGHPIDDIECAESSEVLSLLQPRPGASNPSTRPLEGASPSDRPVKRAKPAKGRGKGFGESKQMVLSESQRIFWTWEQWHQLPKDIGCVFLTT